MRKKYSPSMQHLMALLTPEPQSTTTIAARYYGRRQPKYARQAVNDILRKLQCRIRENREAFRLYRSPRKGPHEMKYWIR